MANGVYSRKFSGKHNSKYSAAKRASAVRLVQKAVRAKLQYKARHAVRKPPVKKAILQNARAIKRLSKQQLGSAQSYITLFDSPVGHHVIRGSPWLFHVNDPGYASGGSGMMHINNLGQSTSFHDWTLWKDPGGYNEEMGTHVAQSPLYVRGVDLQFEIQGFCKNTHVRIDIIRQKKMDTPFWKRTNTSNYLPQTLEKLVGIAGFGPEHINTDIFQVLKTKRLFFNSKGSANLADKGQDRNTLDATTRNIQHCHIYVPVNRTQKPVDPDLKEEMEDGVTNNTNPWHFSNMHPLSNIWCLISTDDKTDIASLVTGDAISVKCVRKFMFRDPKD